MVDGHTPGPARVVAAAIPHPEGAAREVEITPEAQQG